MNTDLSPAEADDDPPLQLTDEEGDTLIALLEELDAINMHAPDAELNRHSIDDNNGGRIELMRRQWRVLPAFIFLRRLRSACAKIAKIV